MSPSAPRPADRPRPGLTALAALAAVALAWSAPAVAYDQETHLVLTTRAWPVPAAVEALAPVTEADLAALRLAVWEAGAGHADPAVRARFLARWPTAGSFDGWGLKLLAGLTPEARVVGVDVPPPPAGDARQAAALGSQVPDEDRRNQDRFAHAPDRTVRRDPWDRPLPADPVQLDMGQRSGLTSQAWAHYGLARIARSDDPAVLKAEPRRFSVPPDAHTFAPEQAQAHTDLALGAASLGTPGGRALAFALLGQSEHYLEDLANQVHTVQAVYPFFVSAKLESVQEDLLTLGGLLGPRRGFIGIGVQIISNHHLFSEALWSSRLRRAVDGREHTGPGQAGLSAVAAGDAALERALDDRGLDPAGPFAEAIAEVLIDASSREGGEVYLAARAVARRRLSSGGYTFADGGDPDADLDKAAEPQALARFFDLQRAAFARAGSAVRRHLELFQAALAPARQGEAGRLALRRTALERLVTRGLAALDEGEARLVAWHPAPPPSRTVSWGYPAGLAILLALAGLWWRRRRRRRGTPAAPGASRLGA